jgi:hypothetical protein
MRARMAVRTLWVLFLVAVALAVCACEHSESEVRTPTAESATSASTATGTDAAAPRLDQSQLRRLKLTYHVPSQVREACTEARRLA